VGRYAWKQEDRQKSCFYMECKTMRALNCVIHSKIGDQNQSEASQKEKKIKMNYFFYQIFSSFDVALFRPLPRLLH
jgi:CRISPR/Cas system CSM-associated protein Csm3 (group 7 of RAMP superfamily)